MLTIIILVILLILYEGAFVYFQWKKLGKYNQMPLDIKTFDGSNSPYHPCVLYNEDSKFHFRYLLVETPFYLSLPAVGPNYRDQFECPSMHYSEDGLNWTELYENPIDKLSLEQKNNRDYFSDPDLFFSPKGIECWYRLNRRYGNEHNQRNISLLRKISKNGIEWSGCEEIACLENNENDKGLGSIVISQSLIYEEGVYKMWFWDKENICYSISHSPTIKWANKCRCKLHGPKIKPWHLHLMKDGDTYWLTIYDRKSITIWESKDGLEFNYYSKPIEPCKTIGSFYSHGLYRACLLKTPDGRYNLYFSADDIFKSYIGLMQGTDPNELKIVSATNASFTNFRSFINIYARTKRYKIASYYNRIKIKIMSSL